MLFCIFILQYIFYPRPRRGSIPNETPPDDMKQRISALESSLTSFAERKMVVVVHPAIGTCFDSITEAYDFYNLYSWEYGFGIRYGKSRSNNMNSKTLQEFYCGCAVSQHYIYSDIFSYVLYFLINNLLFTGKTS